MPKTERFTFTLPPDLRQQLLDYARKKRVNAAQVLREYIVKLPREKR